MLNKRGQGLSTNAIILIVLGVFVLVVLIAGFALGWGTLKERIAPSNNVNSIVSACSVACNTQSQYDYCTIDREIKLDSDGLTGINSNKVGDVNDLSSGDKKSCNEFLKYPNMGIQDCSNLCGSSSPAKNSS